MNNNFSREKAKMMNKYSVLLELWKKFDSLSLIIL